MKFTDFTFSKQVLDGIEKAGFIDCMPVQEEVFRKVLDERKDVLVQSQTGTGKTAAFLLTIFEIFHREKDKNHKALIIAPTRELAVQIEQEAILLGSQLPFNIGCFFGGVGYKSQEQKLKEGVDIMIGTPGRLLDFAQSKKISFKQVDFLIIDEADRLFDMGFLPDLKRMLRQMTTPDKRQTMLFSATLSLKVGQLAWEFMNHPEEITIDTEQITVEEISQILYHTSSDEKLRLLLGILQRDDPKSAIVFTNTKRMAVEVSERLSLNGYQSEYIMGDLPQRKRLSIINRIKKGELRILVATDVAARGLHIDDLAMVINYDIPEDPENYVHRIGRTARAGKSGKAVSFACERFVYGLEGIEALIGMKIPLEWADDTLLQTEDKSKGIRINTNHLGRDKRGSSRKPGSKKPPQKKINKPDRKPKSPGQKPVQKQVEKPGEKQGKKPVQKNVSHKKKPVQRKTGKSPQQPVEKPGKTADVDSRLEYYRKKYGEDFQLTQTGKDTPKKEQQSSNKKHKKKGIFHSLLKKGK